MRYALLLATFLGFSTQGFADPSEAECKERFTKENKAFLSAWDALEGPNASPKKLSNTPLHMQVCIHQWIRKQQSQPPKKDAACVNGWSQWQAVNKSFYIGLCTGKIAF